MRGMGGARRLVAVLLLLLLVVATAGRGAAEQGRVELEPAPRVAQESEVSTYEISAGDGTKPLQGNGEANSATNPLAGGAVSAKVKRALDPQAGQQPVQRNPPDPKAPSSAFGPTLDTVFDEAEGLEVPEQQRSDAAIDTLDTLFPGLEALQEQAEANVHDQLDESTYNRFQVIRSSETFDTANNPGSDHPETDDSFLGGDAGSDEGGQLLETIDDFMDSLEMVDDGSQSSGDESDVPPGPKYPIPTFQPQRDLMDKLLPLGPADVESDTDEPLPLVPYADPEELERDTSDAFNNDVLFGCKSEEEYQAFVVDADNPYRNVITMKRTDVPTDVGDVRTFNGMIGSMGSIGKSKAMLGSDLVLLPYCYLIPVQPDRTYRVNTVALEDLGDASISVDPVLPFLVEGMDMLLRLVLFSMYSPGFCLVSDCDSAAIQFVPPIPYAPPIIPMYFQLHGLGFSKSGNFRFNALTPMTIWDGYREMVFEPAGQFWTRAEFNYPLYGGLLQVELVSTIMGKFTSEIQSFFIIVESVSISVLGFLNFKIGQGYGGFRMAPAGSWEDVCTPSGIYFKSELGTSMPMFGPKFDDVIHFFSEPHVSLEANVRFNRDTFHGFAFRFQASFTLFNLPVLSLEVEVQMFTAAEIERRMAYNRQESGCACAEGFDEDGYCMVPMTRVDRFVFGKARGQDVIQVRFAFSFSLSFLSLLKIDRVEVTVLKTLGGADFFLRIDAQLTFLWVVKLRGFLEIVNQNAKFELSLNVLDGFIQVTVYGSSTTTGFNDQLSLAELDRQYQSKRLVPLSPAAGGELDAPSPAAGHSLRDMHWRFGVKMGVDIKALLRSLKNIFKLVVHVVKLVWGLYKAVLTVVAKAVNWILTSGPLGRLLGKYGAAVGAAIVDVVDKAIAAIEAIFTDFLHCWKAIGELALAILKGLWNSIVAFAAHFLGIGFHQDDFEVQDVRDGHGNIVYGNTEQYGCNLKQETWRECFRFLFINCKCEDKVGDPFPDPECCKALTAQSTRADASKSDLLEKDNKLKVEEGAKPGLYSIPKSGQGIPDPMLQAEEAERFDGASDKVQTLSLQVEVQPIAKTHEGFEPATSVNVSHAIDTTTQETFDRTAKELQDKLLADADTRVRNGQAISPDIDNIARNGGV